jgi:hypothetical protein
VINHKVYLEMTLTKSGVWMGYERKTLDLGAENCCECQRKSMNREKNGMGLQGGSRSNLSPSVDG